MLQEEYDLPEGVVAGAMGLGGGIGRCQAVCGAISGGVVALGHSVAQSLGNAQEARVRTRKLAGDLYRAFAGEFGCTDCRTLTGYDFQAPGGYEAFHERDTAAGERFCNKYVTYTVKTAMRLLE